jgi:hypothetical protein
MAERLDIFAVFAGKIFSDLYDQFPLPSPVSREEALKIVFDLRILEDTRRKLSVRSMYRDLVRELVESQNPHLAEANRREFENLLKNEEGLKRDEQLRREIVQLEGRAKELSAVWDGTLSFLEAEGYVRSHNSLWQLTEKGLVHLQMRFSETKIRSLKGTLISRIKEQLSNPSKITAQTLLHLINVAAERVILKLVF